MQATNNISVIAFLKVILARKGVVEFRYYEKPAWNFLRIVTFTHFIVVFFFYCTLIEPLILIENFKIISENEQARGYLYRMDDWFKKQLTPSVSFHVFGKYPLFVYLFQCLL